MCLPTLEEPMLPVKRHSLNDKANNNPVDQQHLRTAHPQKTTAKKITVADGTPFVQKCISSVLDEIVN